MTVRFSLLLTLVLAAMAYKLVDFNAAKGLAAGGMTGVLVFWIMAYRMEKAFVKASTVESGKTNSLQSSLALWMPLRMVLYGGALIWAHYLDTVTHHGVLGAVVGLFIVHVVMAIIGMTGVDLINEKSVDGTDR